MEMADSLETVSRLAEAVSEYLIVAEYYPESVHHAEAVRKAALLLSNPDNPSSDDSAAIVWFGRYTQLPVTAQDKEYARGYVLLLERIRVLDAEITKVQATYDSMETVNRRLGTGISRLNSDLTNRNKRLQELESELKKLREVDIRLSKTKGK